MFYIKLYRKLPNTFFFINIKQVLFCKCGLLFLRPVFRERLISSWKFSWGLFKKGDLTELRFLGGEGAELKEITSFFQRSGDWHLGGHCSGYFFWCNFSVKLPWLQRIGNKLNTTIFYRYHSQTCKAITFRKITNHTKYK